MEKFQCLKQPLSSCSVVMLKDLVSECGPRFFYHHDDDLSQLWSQLWGTMLAFLENEKYNHLVNRVWGKTTKLSKQLQFGRDDDDDDDDDQYV